MKTLRIRYVVWEGKILSMYLGKQSNEYYAALKERMRYFDGQSLPHWSWTDSTYVWFLALRGKQIIGMLKYRTGRTGSLSHPEYTNWMNFVSVDPEYQGKGIATKLIEMLFEYAEQRQLSILQSGYSTVGWERIRKVFHRIAKQYPNVKFADFGTRPEFM